MELEAQARDVRIWIWNHDRASRQRSLGSLGRLRV
ncbi:MAG: hypothetical protein AVDCRST_MAG29-1475 [uncultured Nocardioidaceae bacterium]|uniref:Uncharacterized protein n=1 Tax=uncultured Nocardioidaceae bacterium TaxID=253824 RepID=A0A6J4LNG9_9ACTN|nr:MAG: hypothetical protein AVDCRST_MAG29-1475 [uncultured Nocardioidaceae bacterium]